MRLPIRVIPFFCACIAGFPGCTAAEREDAATSADGGYVECVVPRPKTCTRDHLPVCGLRDTGVRCVTTPCPSWETKTYGNACDACADTAVYGWRPDACAKEGVVEDG